MDDLTGMDQRKTNTPHAGVLRNTSKQGCERPNDFENEPGVAVFYYPKPYKRTYRTLRIPESVAKRV
jgi:hypothetical protein